MILAEILAEVSEFAEFILMVGFSIFFYYIGIITRYYGWRSESSLPLRQQLILGIPASLIVTASLSPILQAISGNGTSNWYSTFTTLVIFLEHGFILNEWMSRWINNRLVQF